MSKITLQKVRNLTGISGIISLILGLLILLFPGISAQLGTILVGTSFILMGIIYLFSFITLPLESSWSKLGHIILGVLYIVTGIFSLLNITATTAVLFIIIGILVGMTWVYEGCLTLTLAFTSSAKGWTIFSSIISILAGISLLLSPFIGAVALWTLLGTILLVIGIVKLIQFFSWK